MGFSMSQHILTLNEHEMREAANWAFLRGWNDANKRKNPQLGRNTIGPVMGLHGLCLGEKKALTKIYRAGFELHYYKKIREANHKKENDK